MSDKKLTNFNLFEGVRLPFILLVLADHLLPLANHPFRDGCIECICDLTLGFAPLPCLLQVFPEVGVRGAAYDLLALEV